MTAKEAKNIALWNQLPKVLREKIQQRVNMGYSRYTGAFTDWAKEGTHKLLFDDFKPENWEKDRRRHIVKPYIIKTLEELGYIVECTWLKDIHESLKERECYITIKWLDICV